MNRSDLDNGSLRTLAQQAPNHLCWIVFSSVGITTNTLVLITIAMTKSLHNKSQYVILSHAIAELCFMSSYFGTGLARYSAYALDRPETSNQWMCALKQMPLVITGPLMRSFAQALAIDRFLCLAFPIFYKKLRARNYLTCVNSIIWTFALSQGFVGLFFLLPDNLIPVCAYVTIFDPSYTAFISVSSNVSVSLAAAIYFGSPVILFVRGKKFRHCGEAARVEWKRQMDFDVSIAIMVIGVIYLTSSGVMSIMTALASRPTDSPRITLVLNQLISICAFLSSISHLFVYLKFNPTFRKGFVRIFRRANQSVYPNLTPNFQG